VDIDKGAFSITYGDGTQVSGDYINETITIAGATLHNAIMAVALDAQIPSDLASLGLTGILGVSYNTEESIYDPNSNVAPYQNIISQMVLQGVISTRAYSLWLNDLGKSLIMHTRKS
jgi:Eukaryotic aspartyl protease